MAHAGAGKASYKLPDKTNDKTNVRATARPASASKASQSETLAWSDWSGPRWSPREILGEAMGASAALQIIAAVVATRSGKFPQAAVTATGGNQQAAGILLGSAVAPANPLQPVQK